MSRGAPWRGFDYVEGREVERSRDEWRALQAQAARVERFKGCSDLFLFDSNGRITAEVYDKQK